MPEMYICQAPCKHNETCSHNKPHELKILHKQDESLVGCNMQLGNGRCKPCVLINQEWDK